MSERHGLTVLTRLARRRPEEIVRLRAALAGRVDRLAPVAIEVATETGDPIGKVLGEELRRLGDATLARTLAPRLPKDTSALKEAAVAITELARAAATGEEAVSMSLDLAVRLGDTGDFERALAVGREALAMMPSGDAQLSHALASRARITLATALLDLGRPQEAWTEAQAAIALRRLDSDSPDGRARLAHALGVAASSAHGLGWRPEAVAHAREASALYEALDAADPLPHRAAFAGVLSNLATFEIQMGEAEAGVATQRRALEVYRVLADRRPDAYLVQVAIGCNNLANNLSLLRRFEEALPLAEEAVALLEALAQARPAAYGEYLAVALNSLSNRLNDLGRTAEAVACSHRSVESMRRLADRFADAYRPLLARSLHTLAYRLFEGGDTSAALAAAEEAIDIRRMLAAANPRAAGPSLALSRAVRAAILHKDGHSTSAANEIDLAFRQVADTAAVLGRAIAREAGEIGGRYVTFRREAGLAVDDALIAAVLAATGLQALGPVS